MEAGQFFVVCWNVQESLKNPHRTLQLLRGKQYFVKVQKRSPEQKNNMIFLEF